MPRPKSTPMYCVHKRSGRAFVTIDGWQIPLGVASSQESRDAYDRNIGRGHGLAERDATPHTLDGATAHGEANETPHVLPYQSIPASVTSYISRAPLPLRSCSIRRANVWFGLDLRQGIDKLSRSMLRIRRNSLAAGA